MKYQNILNNLYNREIKVLSSRLACKFKEYSDTFDIELKNIWDKNPDCCIGHFGYNFYFRTNKGINKTKYKNIYTMINSIKRKARASGLTLESVGLSKGYKYKKLITI